MEFTKKDKCERWGKMVGVFLGFFIFTTALFLVLKIANKLPQNKYSYLIVMTIVFLIVLVGKLVDNLLK